MGRFTEVPPGLGPELPKEDFFTEEERQWFAQKLHQFSRTEAEWTQIKELLSKRLVYSIIPDTSSASSKPSKRAPGKRTPRMQNKTKYSRYGLLYSENDNALHVATCQEYLRETLRQQGIQEKDSMWTMLYWQDATVMALDAGLDLFLDAGNTKCRGFLHMIPREGRLLCEMRTDMLTDKERHKLVMKNLFKMLFH